MTTDSLTPEARETLKALAEKATRTYWHYDSVRVVTQAKDDGTLVADTDGCENADNNGRYIAAAHPAAILALLAALDEAERERYGLKVALDFVKKAAEGNAAERDRLAADNARMREALEFYADPANWKPGSGACPQASAEFGVVVFHEYAAIPGDDQGDAAREALDKHADDYAAGGLK